MKVTERETSEEGERELLHEQLYKAAEKIVVFGRGYFTKKNSRIQDTTFLYELDKANDYVDRLKERGVDPKTARKIVSEIYASGMKIGYTNGSIGSAFKSVKKDRKKK